MTDAVLPSLPAPLGFLRVISEPLVDLLETHAAVRAAHEGSVDELSIRWAFGGQRAGRLHHEELRACRGRAVPSDGGGGGDGPQALIRTVEMLRVRDTAHESRGVGAHLRVRHVRSGREAVDGRGYGTRAVDGHAHKVVKGVRRDVFAAPLGVKSSSRGGVVEGMTTAGR